MIRINLLPQEETSTKRSFRLPKVGSVVPLLMVVAVIAGLALTHTYQSRKIADLQATIAEEEAESRRLAPEIAKVQRLNREREEVNRRLDVITRLDRDRYFRVHLLDELNQGMPEHMWLTAFEEQGGGRYAVEGVTFSNFLVSDLMQALLRSNHISAVDLVVAERGQIEQVPVVKFKATASALRTAGGVANAATVGVDGTPAPPAGGKDRATGGTGRRAVDAARNVTGEKAARAASGH